MASKCHTRDESEESISRSRQNTQLRVHAGFETQKEVTRIENRGIPDKWLHIKDLCLPKMKTSMVEQWDCMEQPIAWPMPGLLKHTVDTGFVRNMCKGTFCSQIGLIKSFRCSKISEFI